MSCEISVIMPVYNAERYLRDAVRSVLEQAGGDVELIAVDDGSTDDSGRILAELARADPRIVVIAQPNSGKPAIARNRALRRRRGRYVSFLDADDLYRPGRNDTMLGALKRNRAWVACFHEYAMIDADGAVLADRHLTQNGFQTQAAPWLRPMGDGWHECTPAFFKFIGLRYTAIHTSSILIDGHRVEPASLVFNEDLTVCEDADLWVRLAMQGSLGYYAEPLSAYRWHGASITKNADRYLADKARFHEQNYRRVVPLLTAQERRDYRRKIARSLASLAYRQRCAGRKAAAARTYFHALGWCPELRQFAGLAKLMLPGRPPSPGQREGAVGADP